MNREDVRKYIIENELARPEEIEGCTEAEVASLELNCGGRFPEDYRSFLLGMGRRAGSCFTGTRVFAGDLLDAQQEFRDFVADQAWGKTLPDGLWTVYAHQGYMFGFICLRFGGEAPVFVCGYGNSGVDIFSWTFSSFILDRLREEVEVRRMHRKFREEHGRQGG